MIHVVFAMLYVYAYQGFDNAYQGFDTGFQRKK